MIHSELLFQKSIESILRIETQIKRNLSRDLEEELVREWKNPMFSYTVLECDGTKVLKKNLYFYKAQPSLNVITLSFPHEKSSGLVFPIRYSSKERPGVNFISISIFEKYLVPI